jgi:acyl carrier protein
VSKVLGVPISEISIKTAPANVQSWNSVATVLLISELEKQFKVKLDIDDFSGIENLGDVANLMKQKGIKTDLE